MLDADSLWSVSACTRASRWPKGRSCDRSRRTGRHTVANQRADILAAGDIARWPDPHSGERIRVEHWVVARAQGQVAALNMMGISQPFDACHSSGASTTSADQLCGTCREMGRHRDRRRYRRQDCVLRYRRNGKVLAVASIYRDRESLEAGKSQWSRMRDRSAF